MLCFLTMIRSLSGLLSGLSTGKILLPQANTGIAASHGMLSVLS
jgi:hypothetical protein